MGERNRRILQAAKRHDVTAGLVFILVVMFSLLLSAFFLSWQSYYALKQDAESRLQQAMERLNQTTGFAEQAGVQARAFIGAPCTEGVFRSLRILAASTPDIRTLNLTREGYVYCSSVYGPTAQKKAPAPDKRIVLRVGQSLTPGQPVLILQRSGDHASGVLVSIDGYYLRHILLMSSRYSAVYLQVGDTVMTPEGTLLTGAPPGNGGVKWKKDAPQGAFTVFTPFTLAALWHFYTDNHTGSTLLFVVFSVVSGGFSYYLVGKNDAVRQLRNALRKGEIRAWIQPVLTADGRVSGGEILARWIRPDGEVIPPDVFIPLAEHHDLIMPLTRCLFEQVQTHFHPVQSRLPDGFHIAFNISPAQFETPALTQECEAFLAHFHDGKIRLVLEVTERQAIVPGNSQQVLRALRQKGILLALDDFGTGHSGLDYLREYQFDFLKIDRAFTRDVITKTHVGNIVSNIAELANSLNMQIIAEGVETQAQFDGMKQYGVAFFQGYYLSRPLPLAVFIRNL
jgi:sensor c-di-GMP phosphodiesterase-like protein